MKYFSYAKRRSKELSVRIWEELFDLTNYAKTIYGENWLDALQDSYLHILHNYDEEKATELHNYAIRVVKTIYMNKYSTEVSDELTLQIKTDEVSIESFEELNDYDKIDKNLTIDVGSLEDCKKYLLPRFIKDYKFFSTLNSRERNFNYNDLLDMFSEKVIVQAVKELSESCIPPLQELQAVGKKYRSSFRSYSEDRYKESFDTSVEFECLIGGSVVLYKNKSKRKKVIYKINIVRMINRLMNILEGELSRKMEGVTVWSTLSGFISQDIQEVKKMFEQEIVCRLLSQNLQVRVLAYEQGSVLYLTSSSELPNYFYFDILGKRFGVKLEQVVAKEV